MKLRMFTLSWSLCYLLGLGWLGANVTMMLMSQHFWIGAVFTVMALFYLCWMTKDLIGRWLFNQKLKGVTKYGSFVLGIGCPPVGYVEAVQDLVVNWCLEFRVCSESELVSAFKEVAIEFVPGATKWNLNYCPWKSLAWDDGAWIRVSANKKFRSMELPEELMHRVLFSRKKVRDVDERISMIKEMNFDVSADI